MKTQSFKEIARVVLFIAAVVAVLCLFAAVLYKGATAHAPKPECARSAWSVYGYAGYVDPYTAAQRTRRRGAKC
jgi:hypothetical protein